MDLWSVLCMEQLRKPQHARVGLEVTAKGGVKSEDSDIREGSWKSALACSPFRELWRVVVVGP